MATAGKRGRGSDDDPLPDDTVSRDDTRKHPRVVTADGADITLFVARDGHPGLAAIHAPASAYVAEVVSIIIRSMPSLRQVDPTDVILLSEAGAVLPPRSRLDTVHVAAGDVVTVCTNRAPAGSMPFLADVGIHRDLWATLPQAQQAQVMGNFTLRAQLAALESLTTLQALHATRQWPRDAVQLMASEQLGLLQLPPVTQPFFHNPKGFSLASPTGMVLHQPRVALAASFLNAMTGGADSKGYGVLLSGPHGVGKSAVGLLTFLACYAQRLPVVYIPNAADWTSKVMQGLPHGDLYLLKQFMQQNADIILANDNLRGVFLPVMRGEVPLSSDTMEQLAAVSNLSTPKVGVIIDEVQHITFDVESMPTSPSGVYFRKSWYHWSTAATSAFVRMDIASSHGLREFNLPPGEQGRLRFVTPWPEPDAQAFLSHPSSPGFLANTKARSTAIFICGGVIRTLLQWKHALDRDSSLAGWQKAEMAIRSDMMNDCNTWLKKKLKTDEDRAAATQLLQRLIRGETTWHELKSLYDDGLVMRNDDGSVVPVSPVAASVMHSVIAHESRGHVRPLLMMASDGERGYELQHQLYARLDHISQVVPVYTLTADVTEAVVIRSSFAMPLVAVDAAMRDTARAGNVLFLPTSGTFAIDAIIAPKETDDSTAPIVVLEASMTNPRDASRIDKALKWFEPGGVLAQLAAVYPGRREIVVMLCYGGGKLSASASSASRYKELIVAAEAFEHAQLRVVVADRTGLEQLGICFEARPAS